MKQKYDIHHSLLNLAMYSLYIISIKITKMTLSDAVIRHSFILLFIDTMATITMNGQFCSTYLLKSVFLHYITQETAYTKKIKLNDIHFNYYN